MGLKAYVNDARIPSCLPPHSTCRVFKSCSPNSQLFLWTVGECRRLLLLAQTEEARLIIFSTPSAQNVKTLYQCLFLNQRSSPLITSKTLFSCRWPLCEQRKFHQISFLGLSLWLYQFLIKLTSLTAFP